MAKQKKILLSCHDAGAGNVISSLLKSWPKDEAEIYSVVSGPALKVFEQQNVTPSMALTRDISHTEAFELWKNVAPSALITGTSHSAMLERLLIDQAHAHNAFSLAIVDWWSGYASRFSSIGTDDLKFLPKYVAVSDEFASIGAQRAGIPQSSIFVSGNPYWDSLLQSQTASNTERTRAEIRELFSIKEDESLATIILGYARHLNLGLGCDETDLLRVINPLMESNGKGRKVRWLALRHPSEPWEVFNDFVRQKVPGIMTRQPLDARNALIASDWVVGTISTLQFEAALLGKNVLCLAPNGIPEKMPFVEVLNNFGIRTELKEAECRPVLEHFLSESSSNFNRDRLPLSITQGFSAKLIAEKLQKETL